MTTTPKPCGTCKHIDSTKTTARELWVACKLTGKRTALSNSQENPIACCGDELAKQPLKRLTVM